MLWERKIQLEKEMQARNPPYTSSRAARRPHDRAPPAQRWTAAGRRDGSICARLAWHGPAPAASRKRAPRHVAPRASAAAGGARPERGRGRRGGDGARGAPHGAAARRAASAAGAAHAGAGAGGPKPANGPGSVSGRLRPLQRCVRRHAIGHPGFTRTPSPPPPCTVPRRRTWSAPSPSTRSSACASLHSRLRAPRRRAWPRRR
jgi:hypothetical protein